MSRRAEIVGWGMYVPERVLTNDDLAEFVDTSDEWIRTRTGIERRHVVEEDETTAQMSIEAARAALETADVNPLDIDLIIVGTATPDHSFPATACQVQNGLGAVHAGAFDLNAGCSGFVYALTIGEQAIASGANDLVLVIGADTMSRVTNWQDRSTCVLFGDGAGAVLLRASNGPTGIVSTLLGSDGSGGDLLHIPAGGSAQPTSQETVEKGLHTLQMNGRQVFRFAVRMMPRAVREVAEKAGIKTEEIDLILPHQANMRIVTTAARRLNLPLDNFFVNLEEYGNTSAASIPIALCEAMEKERIKPGQNIVLVGFGAGLTWAAALIKWGTTVEEVAAPFYNTWRRWILYRWAAINTALRRFHQGVVVRLIRFAERVNQKLGRD
ncbi:MAG: beta-ketoacyl-ACP synthase III [Chloroflexota bacterium]